MPELGPMETMRLPEPPESVVRETGSGRELGARELDNGALRTGDFSTFQASEELGSAAEETTPRSTGKTPWARFTGVFPRTSSGWIGTIPTAPVFERTQVAVAGRQAVKPPLPRSPGTQTQPKPGWKIQPP